MSVNWRAWRLVIDTIQNGSGPYVIIEYFAVTATVGGASIFSGGTASASSEFSGAYVAANAFDDNSTSWATLSGGLPGHVQYDRGSGNSTAGRFLYVRGYPANHVYSPKIMRLQGSADGSTGWTTLVEVDIAGYTLFDKWVIASNGTLLIPFGHIVSGNSTLSSGAPAQRVLVSDWASGKLIDSKVPDAAGNWQSVIVGSADVLVTHIGNSGYKALADGPVTPALR